MVREISSEYVGVTNLQRILIKYLIKIRKGARNEVNKYGNDAFKRQ